MRRSLQRVVGSGFLFLLGVLACSSRDNPKEDTATVQEDLTQAEIGRILSFEGTIGPTGDWVPTGGTVASSTTHASAGTHSMVMSSASSISVESTLLSALGTVGANLSVDIWLPSTLTGQNKGNIQAFFTSGTLSLNSYATSNVQLSTLTPGQFSKINIPLDSTLQSNLSKSGYTDLKVKFIFNLADTNQTYVDNVKFSSGSGGTGGTSGTGGSKSNGGAGGTAGTKAVGGTIGIGGTNAGGSKSGGTSSIGGTKSTGGVTGTGGKSTGGATGIGGTKTTGGATGIGGTKTTGGATGTGGKAAGGTSSTGGSKTTGGTVSTGGTKSTGGTSATGGKASGGAPPTGGTKSTGGTVSTGGTKSTGGTTFRGTGGTPPTGGAPATGGVIIIVGTGGSIGAGGVSSLGGTTSSLATSAGGSGTVGGATSGGAGGATNIGGSTGTGGSSAAGGTTGTGGTSGTGGSSGSADVTFFLFLPEGVRRQDVALATSGGDLWLDDQVKVVAGAGGFSSVSSVGGNVQRLGVQTEVQNVWTTGSVTLANATWVHGFVESNSQVNTQPDSVISGTVSPLTDPWVYQTVAWQVHFPAVSQTPIFLQTNQSLVPGAYPAVSVRAGAHLGLSTGTYTLDSLTVDPGAVLDIDNTAGPVFVYMLNNFTFAGTVNRIANYANVLFGVASTNPVAVQSAFTGELVAPNADLTLSTSASGYRGSFFARSVRVNGQTTITQEPLQPFEFCSSGGACSSFCPCATGGSGCVTSDQCDTGVTCSPTGVCGCQPQCAGKTCADNPSDGCGGTCAGVCGNGQLGCVNDLQCAIGSACIIGGGPQKGGAPGTNVCLPAICASMNPQLPNCGVGNADCGPCPACVKQCTGRTCGSDGCGGECGPTPTGQVCIGGQLVDPYNGTSDHSAHFPPPLSVGTSPAIAGAVPASLGVSSQGKANYTIPIEVPPGRLGLQVQLAIQYQGTNMNGMMAQGWSLIGLSHIERCRKTVAEDGVAAAVTLKDGSGFIRQESDDYCLDGQKLLADTGSSAISTPSHTHHTEIENFKLIQEGGNDPDPSGDFFGPKSFKVWTKNGLIMTYGGAIMSDQGTPSDPSDGMSAIANYGGVRVAWYLSKVEDRTGNYMLISYLPPNGIEVLPDSITYGGNSVAYPGDRAVTFKYVTRNDAHPYRVADIAVNSTQLLSSIQTSVAGTVVRQYNFNYAQDTLGNSQLTSVALCGAESGTMKCLPSTTFQYAPIPSDLGQQLTNVDLSNSSNSSTIRKLQVFDWNGDGTDELLDGRTILRAVKDPSSSSLSISAAPQTFSQDDPIFLDINNDGRDDFVQPFEGDYLLSGVTDPTSGAWQDLGFTNKSTGSYSGVPCSPPTQGGTCSSSGFSFSAPAPTLIGDFNGDGLKDVSVALPDQDGVPGHKRAVYLHKFPFDPVGPAYFEGPSTAAYSGDYGGNNAVALDYTGSGADSVYVIPSAYSVKSSDVLVLDTNGDGRKEIAFAQVFPSPSGDYVELTILHPIAAGGQYLQVVAAPPRESAISTDLLASGLKNAFIADYDNDGRDDIIFPRLGGLFISKSYASSDSYTWVDNAFPALMGTFVLADVDGDGDREWVGSTFQQVPGSSGKNINAIYRGMSGQTGLLTSVTDGLGKTSLITYGSNYDAHSYWLTGGDLSFYTGNQPSNVVQYLSKVGPMVSDIQDAQYLKINNQVTVNIAPHHKYNYAGAVAGLGGRGFLGFFSQTVAELDNNQVATFTTSTTISDVYSGFPLAGLPKTIETLTDTSDNGSGTWQRVATSNSWSVGTSRISGAKLIKLDSTNTWVSDNMMLTAGSCDPVANPFCLPNPLSTQKSYLYDDYGNIQREIKSTTVAPGNFSDVTVTTASYQSDSTNWLISNPLGITVQDMYKNAIETRVSAYDYYPNGLLKSETREPTLPEFYLKTTYDRDPVVGNITKVHVTDSAGNERTTGITYDSRKLYMKYLTNAKGQVTELQYDETSGRLATRVAPNAQIEQWSYDLFGRVREAVSPTDTVNYGYLPVAGTTYPYVGYSWDALAIVQTSTAFGVSSVILDQFGRKTQVKSTGLDGKTISSEFGYDIRGRLTTQAQPHMPGDTTQGATYNSYDGLGRVRSVTPPGAQATRYTYVGTSVSTDYAWLFSSDTNGAWRAVIEQAPSNQQSISVTDYAGRPLRSIQIDGPPGSALNGPPTTGIAGSSYSYGPFGTVLTVTDADRDPTSNMYDSLGRRTSSANATTGTHTYSYNAFGEVIDDTDGNGAKRCHYYDVLSRETSLRESVSGSCDSSGHLIASWDYDGVGDNEIGRLVKSYRESSPGSATGTTQFYHYEPFPSSGNNTGRLSSIEQYVPGMSAALLTSMDYDGPRLHKVHYPAAGSTSFDVQYDYDPVGNLTAVRDANTQSTYWQIAEYQSGLRVRSEQFGNGVQTRTDYLALEDCANLSLERCVPGTPRTLTTSLPSSSNLLLQQLVYDYNAAGYVKSRDISGPGEFPVTNLFQTDGLGRLKSYTWYGIPGDAGTESYNYTSGGDISSVTRTINGNDASEQYTYQFDRQHLATGHKNNNYLYDNNGSQITRSGPDIPNGLQTLEYNDLPMPWRITSGTDLTLLEYDASGTRVAKRDNDTSTIYVGSLYDCTGPSVPTGSPFSCNEHHYKVYAGSKLVAQVTRDTAGATTATRYIHADLLGSATTVTDELGAIAETRAYDSFGNTSTNFTTSNIHTGYTGQEQDPELGLVNMGGRLYDPALRRFTTADPYVTEPLNPQGLNRYSYVQNNPMSFTDPSGFQPFDSSSYSQQMSNYYSQQAWIQEIQARSQFFEYLGNIAESGPATPPTNVPSIEDIAQMDSAGSTPSVAVDWGRFNDMANQASARGLDQARAQNVQMGDVMRAHDAGFTNPFSSGVGGAPSAGGASGINMGNGGNNNGQGTSANGQGLPDVYHPSPLAQFAYSVPIVMLTPAAMAELFGGSKALYRGTAGFASGYTSGLATGQDPSSALRQGLINAAISAANPFGFVPYVPSVAASPLNAMLSSGINQLATNGSVNVVSVGISGGMRFGFGFATGGFSPDTLSSAFTTGAANGIFSSSIRTTGGW